MVYITGDKHRNYQSVEDFCQVHHTTKDDIMIVLGDNGINWFGGERDKPVKERLQSLPITFFLIRGNHDMRPDRDNYRIKWVKVGANLEGWFRVEPEYPDLLFAVDGGIYKINGIYCAAIGGAYSVDKQYRLQLQELGYDNYKWFADEQLNKKERDNIEQYLSLYEDSQPIEVFLTHTCPLRYKPWDMLPSHIPDKNVDETMEKWFDEIYDMFPSHKAWYCGHWHIERKIDRMRFMFHDIEEFLPEFSDINKRAAR